MADLNGALIGFAGVLVGGYFNNFFAEDFRRFRDSQALAGALAGELESHGEAIPILLENLPKMQAIAEEGKTLSLPEWPQPNSPVFEANVEKIGILGPELAKEVAFVYEQIRAFRGAFHLLSKHHKDEGIDANWRTGIIKGCIARISSAEEKGRPLVENLKRRAKGSYWRQWGVLKQCAVGAVAIFFLAFLVAHYAGSSDGGIRCVTTVDHGSSQTVCK